MTSARPETDASACARCTPSRRVPAASTSRVLVPAKDEAENLPLFMEQAAAAFAAASGHRYEVVVIDDGSVDDTWAVLEQLAAPVSVPAQRRAIASAAESPTRCAPDICIRRGSVLVFYPADLQFKPEDIPRLVAPILAGDVGHGHRLQEGEYEKAFVSGVYNR